MVAPYDVAAVEDFGAGIYRGREAPPGAVYDAVNALVDDEGQLFKRGSSAYLTANVGAAIVGLAETFFDDGDGNTTRLLIAWGAGSGQAYFIDDAAAVTAYTPDSPLTLKPFARAVKVGDYVVVPLLSAAGAAFLGDSAATAGTLGVSGGANPHFEYVAAVGNPARLIATSGGRVYFSDPGAPATIPAANNYQLAGVRIIGADSLQGAAVLFTTSGVWVIENMFLDPVDQAGNVQHQVLEVNRNLILWGDPGVSAWEGALVVPAIDDVYLMTIDGQTRSVSGGIRPLYRSYVKAGYQPGLASVHRGHYFLPVLSGTSLVDVLVCRLDRPYGDAAIRPWTRWAGHAASSIYAQRVGGTDRTPKLFGVSGQRVTDLSGCMDVVSGAMQDADATTPVFVVEGGDVLLRSGSRPGTATRARAMYETTGGTPTVALKTAVGAEGSAFSSASLLTGGGASDGTAPSAWQVNRRGDRIRWRFESASQVTSLILRWITLSVRRNGRA